MITAPSRPHSISQCWQLHARSAWVYILAALFLCCKVCAANVSLAQDASASLGLRTATADNSAACQIGSGLAANGQCIQCNLTYTYSVNPKVPCQTCRPRALCVNGVTIPRDGFWQSSPFVPQFVPCYLGGSCIYSNRETKLRNFTVYELQVLHNQTAVNGSVYEEVLERLRQDLSTVQCGPGYLGRFCGICDYRNNYARLGEHCVKCSDDATTDSAFNGFALILEIGFLSLGIVIHMHSVELLDVDIAKHEEAVAQATEAMSETEAFNGTGTGPLTYEDGAATLPDGAGKLNHDAGLPDFDGGARNSLGGVYGGGNGEDGGGILMVANGLKRVSGSMTKAREAATLRDGDDLPHGPLNLHDQAAVSTNVSMDQVVRRLDSPPMLDVVIDPADVHNPPAAAAAGQLPGGMTPAGAAATGQLPGHISLAAAAPAVQADMRDATLQSPFTPFASVPGSASFRLTTEGSMQGTGLLPAGGLHTNTGMQVHDQVPAHQRHLDDGQSQSVIGQSQVITGQSQSFSGQSQPIAGQIRSTIRQTQSFTSQSVPQVGQSLFMHDPRQYADAFRRFVNGQNQLGNDQPPLRDDQGQFITEKSQFLNDQSQSIHNQSDSFNQRTMNLRDSQGITSSVGANSALMQGKSVTFDSLEREQGTAYYNKLPSFKVDQWATQNMDQASEALPPSSRYSAGDARSVNTRVGQSTVDESDDTPRTDAGRSRGFARSLSAAVQTKLVQGASALSTKFHHLLLYCSGLGSDVLDDYPANRGFIIEHCLCMAFAGSKIIFTYAQTLGMVLMLRVFWPPKLYHLQQRYDFASFLTWSNLDCSLTGPPASRAVKRIFLQMMMPIFYTAAFLVLWLFIMWRRWQIIMGKEPCHWLGRRMVLTLLQTWDYTYPLISFNIIELFRCQHLAAPSKNLDDLYIYYTSSEEWTTGWFWQSAPHNNCFKGVHLSAMLFLGIPGMVFFVIGYPLCCFLIVQFNKKRLSDPYFILQFGWIYEDYKPKYSYWESIVMLRKVLLILVIHFTSTNAAAGSAVQVQLLLVVLALFALYHERVQPFFNPVLNQLERVSHYVCLFTALGVAVFVDPNLQAWISNLTGAILGTVWALTLLWLIVMVVIPIVLTGIILIDADGDGKISLADLKSTGYRLTSYLGNEVHSISSHVNSAVHNTSMNVNFAVQSAVTSAVNGVQNARHVVSHKVGSTHQQLHLLVPKAMVGKHWRLKMRMKMEKRERKLENRALLERQATMQRQVTIERPASMDRQATLEQQATLQRQPSLERQTTVERPAALERQPTIEQHAALEQDMELNRQAMVERHATSEHQSAFAQQAIAERLNNARQLTAIELQARAGQLAQGDLQAGVGRLSKAPPAQSELQAGLRRPSMEPQTQAELQAGERRSSNGAPGSELPAGARAASGRSLLTDSQAMIGLQRAAGSQEVAASHGALQRQGTLEGVSSLERQFSSASESDRPQLHMLALQHHQRMLREQFKQQQQELQKQQQQQQQQQQHRKQRRDSSGGSSSTAGKGLGGKKI